MEGADLPASHTTCFTLPLVSHSQTSLLKPHSGISVGGLPFGQTTEANFDVGLKLKIFMRVCVILTKTRSDPCAHAARLPDSFGLTLEMEDGHELDVVSYMLQVVNGIVQISLPVFIKVN